MKKKIHLHNKAAFLIAIIGNIFVVAIAIFLQKNIESSKMYQNVFPTTPAENSIFLTIKNSGSTNFLGYTLKIWYNGSGEITYQNKFNGSLPQFLHKKNKTFTEHTFDITSSSQVLNQIGDVSSIGHGCVKSVSFGSITTITYRNKTSGDISCIDSNDPQLYQQLTQQINGHISKATSL